MLRYSYGGVEGERGTEIGQGAVGRKLKRGKENTSAQAAVGMEERNRLGGAPRRLAHPG